MFVQEATLIRTLGSFRGRYVEIVQVMHFMCLDMVDEMKETIGACIEICTILYLV